MTVKELIDLLKPLDQDAQIDISSDEEGNSFGDIDTAFAEGHTLSGAHVYSLYPKNSEMPEYRYHNEEKGGDRI